MSAQYFCEVCKCPLLNSVEVFSADGSLTMCCEECWKKLTEQYEEDEKP